MSSSCVGSSLLLRAAPALRAEDPGAPGDEALRRASLGEESRLLELGEHLGARVLLFDESSGMASGTIKSLDGALAAAEAVATRPRAVVVESGGNTAEALARYLPAVGAPVVCVVPEDNAGCLDSSLFGAGRAALVAVAEPQRVKECAAALAEAVQAVRWPRVDRRLLAGLARGLALREALAGARADWLAQTVSAAFGPIGMLRAFDAGARPRLLALQQQGNSPFADRLAARRTREALPLRQLRLPAIYDRDPFSYGTFEAFRELMDQGGRAAVVSRKSLDSLRARRLGRRSALEALAAAGIEEPARAPEAVDGAGLLALAGALDAIERGELARGETVVVCFTSGARRRRGGARPLAVVPAGGDCAEAVRALRTFLPDAAA